MKIEITKIPLEELCKILCRDCLLNVSNAVKAKVRATPTVCQECLTRLDAYQNQGK